jgi:hypothetical protein
VQPKFARTVITASSVTTQLPVPEQLLPLQPVNVAPGSGVSVSVTTVPSGNDAVHVVPQRIPSGTDVITPKPSE